MYIYLSILAFALLFATSAVSNIAITFILFFSLYIIQRKSSNILTTNSNNFLPSILILIWLSLTFVFRWRESPKPEYIANFIGINVDIFLIICAIILSIVAYNCINRLVNLANHLTNINTTKIGQPKINISFFLLIIATIAITIFSHCSPLYPFQTWCDPNFFFTVGKSILDGVVPYRDLYEQKGPLLYFIHTFAALISYRTFLGVYLFEIIVAWSFLLISNKIISLFCDNNNRKIICAVLCVIVYSSLGFYMGDTAEEFCLPCIVYALYVGVKSIKTNCPITNSQAIIVGILAACVLWIKFSICGFYIGWIGYLLYFYIKNKWSSKILPTFLFAIIGFIILTIPIFIYFIYNDALTDFIQTYFINNTSLYGNTSNNIVTLLKNVLRASNSNFVWLLIIASIFVVKKHNCHIYFLTTLCSLLILIYFRISFAYYEFILAAFAPIGISLFCSLKKKSFVLIITLFIMQIGTNTILFTQKENLAHYRFNQIIKQESNPTLLNYGFPDSGFYTFSGIVPSNRFFGRLNIPHPEMMPNQDSIADNGVTIFIVTQRFIGNPEKREFQLYEKIAEETHYGEKWEPDVIYTLYKRKENVNIK